MGRQYLGWIITTFDNGIGGVTAATEKNGTAFRFGFTGFENDLQTAVEKIKDCIEAVELAKAQGKKI